MFKNSGSMLSTFILPISLVCIFAFLALILTFMGSENYKSIKANYDATGESTVSVSYLTTKVRQNNQAGVLSIVHQNGGDKLVVREEIKGKTFRTEIFVKDQSLYESTFEEGTLDGLEDNLMRVADAKSMTIRSDNGKLLQFEVIGKSGQSYKFSVNTTGVETQVEEGELL